MTRVLDYGNEANYDPGRPPWGAWAVYGRLVRYALRYKGRLAIVILLSTIVAFSFTSMILSAGFTINLLYGAQDEFDARVGNVAKNIRSITLDNSGAPRFGVFGGLDQRFTTLAADMRADKGRGFAVLCAALVMLAVVGGLSRFFQEYVAGAIGVNISAQLNREMFRNVLRQSHRFFEGKTTGEVVARFTNDAFMVNKGLANVFVKVFREPIKAVFFLGTALFVNAFLTLIVLLILPPVALVILAVGRRVKKSARRSLQKVASMASVVHETVAGIAVVKSFRMEEYEKSRFEGEIGKLRRYLIRMAQADAAIGPATEFIMVLGLVAFIMLAERQVSSGALAPGDLFVLFGALAAMLDPLRKLATVNNLVQTSVASAERVFEFMDAQPDVSEKRGAVELAPLRRALRFENVRFSYDGQRDVLRGLNFELRRGEMVALVGFSGGGKSTIAKLIPRFYDPTGGRITIDGTDIRDATLASLRDQISFVTQETVLFRETVRGNIAFGRTDIPDERIREAARAAHADEFIESLSGGYDAVLEEGGGNLSAGQRQRLAIARAIIKDPAILILDEATSSLDSESEKAIQDAINRFVVGRTSLVIAHRLSTIQRADRILVIDGGRVIEEGTHAQLLAKGGLYQRLYDVQFRTGEAAP